MKARIFFLSALFSLLAITMHADETYYLQSTTTPGQATGDLTYDANGGTGEVIADAAMSQWCT